MKACCDTMRYKRATGYIIKRKLVGTGETFIISTSHMTISYCPFCGINLDEWMVKTD